MVDETTASPASPATPEPAPAAEPTLEGFANEVDGTPPAPVVPEGSETERPPTDVRSPASPPSTELAPDTAAARKILIAAKKAERAAATAQTTGEKALAQARVEALGEFKADPAKVLAEAGLTIDQFLMAVSGHEAAPKPEDRITALEKLIADQKATAELAAKAAEVEAAKARVTEAVKANAEKFPHITRVGAHPLVSEVMMDYYAQHGTALDHREAAKQVESFLAKLQGEPTPPPTPPPPPPTPPPAGARTPSISLSNLSGRDAPPDGDGFPMDDGDARLQAVLATLQ